MFDTDTERVMQQMELVRESGKTNMFDQCRVTEIAEDEQMEELYQHLKNMTNSDYMAFLMDFEPYAVKCRSEQI